MLLPLRETTYSQNQNFLILKNLRLNSRGRNMKIVTLNIIMKGLQTGPRVQVKSEKIGLPQHEILCLEMQEKIS